MVWKIGLLLLAPLAAALLPSQLNGNESCVALNGVSPQCRSNEASYHREFFYVGGRYVEKPGPPPGSILIDRIYVEIDRAKWTSPISSTWLQTPDNRQGWASYFVERGYEVYIVDALSVGRSLQQDLTTYPLVGGFTAENTEALALRSPKGRMHIRNHNFTLNGQG
ncbi:MAG: hypothetical protein M1816_007848 [Peltula sp. TS41687]|nr:MAG: hypothetical protein M1816_007848 [Peltula sp. TS41687]